MQSQNYGECLVMEMLSLGLIKENEVADILLEVAAAAKNLTDIAA